MGDRVSDFTQCIPLRSPFDKSQLFKPIQNIFHTDCIVIDLSKLEKNAFEKLRTDFILYFPIVEKKAVDDPLLFIIGKKRCILV